MLKKLLLLYILVFALLVWSYENDQSRLKISLFTATNKLGRVNINLYIKNNTPNPVNIYQYNNTMIYVLGYYLNFDIYNNDQKLELTYGQERVKFPFKNDFITLKPRDIYREKIDLTSYYNLIGAKENDPWPKGEYTVICNYSYKYSGTKYGRNLWEGTAISDTLKIVVK